ncbi:twin-arginine translocase TatA/TatE family subunit [Halorarius halobius]|uniref:twin-arginine translocase TatA/TatE family subunit n=1 Tax=Halorarius halobius TaxID=2962671 RepID=UPI0020CB98B9|nr:twin-arginine translocase TatA/TatE family subunit [Halorarius halobius]
MIPMFVGIPGGPELLVILLVAVLLFGADRLPKLARSSGEAMGEFKKGRAAVEAEIREAAAERSEAADAETAETAETATDSA